MNDRELLELAAKAAGIGPVIGFEDGNLVIGPRKFARYWNPLTDDGDALRLAVMLRLDVSINIDIQVAWWHGDSLEFVTESLGNDHLAAARRAIVRAAAEIGRATP